MDAFVDHETIEIPAEVHNLPEVAEDFYFFNFRECVMEMRARALLYRGVGGDPVDLLKQRFVLDVMGHLRECGLGVPASFSLYVTAQEKERAARKAAELNAQQEEYRDEGYQGFSDRLDTIDEEKKKGLREAGVHERIAERSVEVERERNDELFVATMEGAERNVQESLQRLLKELPDPRVIIDTLMGARNGKLPV
ncbi:MAG: hypothetical protein Q7S89_02110 [bacterium]|nr:hypothetical protein [bacterium]